MPLTTTQSDYTGRAEANTDYSITGLHQNRPRFGAVADGPEATHGLLGTW